MIDRNSTLIKFPSTPKEISKNEDSALNNNLNIESSTKEQ